LPITAGPPHILPYKICLDTSSVKKKAGTALSEIENQKENRRSSTEGNVIEIRMAIHYYRQTGKDERKKG